MSLQTRFVLLFTVITLTMTLCMVSALHFGRRLELELTRPYEATVSSLAILADLREAVALNDVDRLRRIKPRLEPELVAEQIGPGTMRNMQQRIERVIDQSASESDMDALIALVSRTEATLHQSAVHEQRFGKTLSRSYRALLIIGLCVSVLTWLLAAMLVRRWLVKPVLVLHEATERFATGDLAHRVDVPGSGELTILGNKLNDMAGTIDRMQAEAVERERLAAMGELVRRLVHHIRSPLAGIRGMAELTLRRQAREAPIEEQQTEIIEAVDRFEIWLTELLSVTTPGEVRAAPVRPRDWLGQVLQSLQPLVDSRDQQIRTDAGDAPEEVVIDERQLEQALVGILTNAIEVGPRGSDIHVTLRSQGEDAWSITVSDQGPGIPPDIQARIFQPYFTTKRDGNGIGLAVALDVVRRHGGRIDVESHSGRGTTMTLHLPISVTKVESC